MMAPHFRGRTRTPAISCECHLQLFFSAVAFVSDMDNEGFRKLLLQQSRAAPAAVTGTQHERGDEKNHQDGAIQEQHVPRTKKMLDEINARYVDRAELRRKGVEELGEDLLGIKGLDLSLVAKARAERAQAFKAVTSQGLDDQRQGDTSIPEKSMDVSRASASGRCNQGRHLARAIEAALLEVTKEAPAHLGASLASTSYVYVTESDKYEVPVIRKRASNGMAETTSEEADRAAAARRRLPKAVIGEICSIMRYCGENTGGKKVNGANGVDGGMGGANVEDGEERLPDGALASAIAKPRVPPLQTLHGDEKTSSSDEEDIFGDAGTDYVPTANKEPDVSVAKSSTYFSESAAVALMAGGKVSEDENREEVSGHGTADEEKRGGSLRAKRIAMQSDGYDECYPGYDSGVEMASDVDDEPEEQAPAVMTKKAKKMAKKKEQARLEGEMNSIQKIFEAKSWKGFEDKPPQNAVPKKKRRI